MQLMDINTHLPSGPLHSPLATLGHTWVGLHRTRRGRNATCREGVSFRSTGAAALFPAAAFRRSAPRASLCLPRPPVVLLSSAWTK